MISARVTKLRSIELGVRDLKISTVFYQFMWGLEQIAADTGAVWLRGTGSEHHILKLRQTPKATVLSVGFAVPSREAVDALAQKATSNGVQMATQAAELPMIDGGGYGFSIFAPDGQILKISSDVRQWSDSKPDSAVPQELTHIVFNSDKIDTQLAFFTDVLGFQLSDSTRTMEFIRCSRDHHAIAIARGEGPSLNHMAFKMADLDDLMTATGRLKRNGMKIEWGVGRHGPGNNIFSYFVEPNGFVAEYTTGMEQIDDPAYVPKTARFWSDFPLRPCRWGLATTPSDRIKLAFSGQLQDE